MKTNEIRNLSIIAHVDHGKTTLLDGVLHQAGIFAAHSSVAERVMDSGDLEREKGITILAKNVSVPYRGHKLNIIDTPGHSDFGGEVERILGSVDGALLLVDAFEGPLPQTRFVLAKAIAEGLKIILVLNKLDRSELMANWARVEEVIDQTFDLFVELGASEEQCDFPIVYAVARDAWCSVDEAEARALLRGEGSGSLEPLFELMVDCLPPPRVESHTQMRMQLYNLSWSDYVGHLAVGKVVSGQIKKKDRLYCLGYDEQKGAKTVHSFQVTHLYTFAGVQRQEVDELSCGDIGIVAGCDSIAIGDTLASQADAEPFVRLAVDAPTLKMTFSVNSGPFSGRDGEAVQSRKLRERLERECRANVALSFEEAEYGEQFYLLGRGELQFAVFIETLRREGLEFMVGRPVVMLKSDDTGAKLEPIEEATLDMQEEASGEVTKMLQSRKGILESFTPIGEGRVRLVFAIPTRGLIGTRSKYLTITKGLGLFSTKLKDYAPFKGDIQVRKNGTLVADRSGKCTDYALATLENRGVLFVKPGTEVYEGMVIGECARENDMNVNPVRPKKLTNVRSVSSDGLVMLSGTRDMSLEQMIEWIDDDEWIECTPNYVRIRKKVLPANQRSVIRGK